MEKSEQKIKRVKDAKKPGKASIKSMKMKHKQKMKSKKC